MFETLLAMLGKFAPIRDWAMFGAAPAITVFAAWLVWIVWKGGWGADRQEQQLWYLGSALLGLILMTGVIVVALAAVDVRGFGISLERRTP